LLFKRGEVSALVGRTFSFADKLMKKPNGTNHTHREKYASICRWGGYNYTLIAV